MTTQELLDEGHGLWYIVLEHTNHRYRGAEKEILIYDDIDAAEAGAIKISNLPFQPEEYRQTYHTIMVKDFNDRYTKHMPPVQHGHCEWIVGEK